MSLDFQKVLRRISYGRPLRGQKELAPLAKRSTCSKSTMSPAEILNEPVSGRFLPKMTAYLLTDSKQNTSK